MVELKHVINIVISHSNFLKISFNPKITYVMKFSQSGLNQSKFEIFLDNS